MLLQIFYFIPAILGTLFIAVGLYHGSKFYSLTRRCTQEGMGTLLGFEEKKMKSGTLYYPVVRFTSQDGKTHRARYAFGNAEWNYVAGDELPLRYNPENPGRDLSSSGPKPVAAVRQPGIHHPGGHHLYDVLLLHLIIIRKRRSRHIGRK